MNREEQFERMLRDIQANETAASAKMDRLKAENKTKSVTYRELMGQRMMLRHMLSLYRAYGLLEDTAEANE